MPIWSSHRTFSLIVSFPRKLCTGLYRSYDNKSYASCLAIISNNQIFLAFYIYNNFDPCHLIFIYMYMYILLRNKISLFPKWLQRPTCPIPLYFSVMNMGKVNFRNSTNSYKIIKKSYNDNFFTVQGATKVPSDSPGLVEWLDGLAFSYRSLPDRQAPLVPLFWR